MTPFQNILTLDQFSLIREGKSVSFSDCPWWTDCISQVKIWICQDRTTTKDNLYEKAMNYARNYLCGIQELSPVCKDDVVREIADEVEKNLKDVSFDQRPPASVIAQHIRMNLPEDPEKRFIRLR